VLAAHVLAGHDALQALVAQAWVAQAVSLGQLSHWATAAVAAHLSWQAHGAQGAAAVLALVLQAILNGQATLQVVQSAGSAGSALATGSSGGASDTCGSSALIVVPASSAAAPSIHAMLLMHYSFEGLAADCANGRLEAGNTVPPRTGWELVSELFTAGKADRNQCRAAGPLDRVRMPAAFAKLTGVQAAGLKQNSLSPEIARC
jgi:hypothetical protein